ncbi:glycoside hydrolase family 43 protein [Pedobacter rhodius]|uniref:Glycoside hydrolase family 43 protein n=1 Tax=Pedobacter rhodius TaxID=3004098 RepID=A0ABT4KW71_9SPHI|nr:glycoside hydrolase family 43 protein [Pedobacter sp. SJ11]MCZ4223178.1 glycoside hydrolase family 43 protein [Pedobacter sp. SJ11]
MKKILIICTLLISILMNVQAQSKKGIYLFAYFKDNGEDGLHLAYSTDAYNWAALKNDKSFLTPMVSKDKLMRDPCILRGADGLFHMVWTVSWKSNGIGYASSKDLINWSPQQFLPVMEKEPGVGNSWAPEITFDNKTKTYMIYWSSTIKGKFPETLLKKEEGNNNRIYYVTTKDFKTFSPTQLLYEPGFNVIDASIVHDNGRFVMFLKDETKEPAQKNIKIAHSDNLTGPYSKASEPITGNYWAEGPTSLRIGKEWIVYFDKYTEHKYGAIKSEDLKTWTDVSDKISLPKGLRHGTIITITKKELEKLQKQ